MQVSGGYEIRASGLFGMPGLSSGPGCSGIQAGLTLFTDSLGSTVLQIDPLDGPEDATAAIEAIRAGDSELSEAELAALRLRQISVTLNCKIPIGQTGFVVSRLSGSLTLNEGSTRVDVGVSIESSLSLPGLGAAVRGDVDAYVQSSPFEMGLNGSLYVFIFQVGGANIKISESRGFEATVFVQMVWGRGDLYVRAWSAFGQFNLTGRATISVGFAKGSIWRGCLKYPCCSLPRCSWKWFAKLRCSGGGCSLCDGPCVDVPPFNLNLGQVGAEFGRFTGDRWGFKGTVNVNFFGKSFGTGFFIDQRGNLSVGNVDNIRLVTSSQIAEAHTAFLTAQNEGTLTADWNRNGIGFTQQGDATVTVPITTTSNVIFAMSRNQDTPKFTLLSPNNTAIGPTSLPDNVSYQEIITYTESPNLTPQNLAGLAPELTKEVHVSGLYAKESDPTLVQACAVLAESLTELIEQELGVTAIDDEGQIRLVNATSDQLLIDILVNDQPALESGVGVGYASLYDFFKIGTLEIKAVPAGKTAPVLAETTLVLAKDAIYTLGLVGGNGNYELFTYTDSPTAPPAGFGRVRFINLAVNSGSVDVELVGRQLLFNNIGYSTDTEYVDVPVGAHSIAVTVNGAGDVLQRSRINVGDGDVITMLSLNNASNLPRLWLPQIDLLTPSYIPPTPRLITPQQTGADQFAITSLLDVTPPAALRLVHAVRGAAAVNGSLSIPNNPLGPQRVFENVGYKGVSSYINSDPGELVVSVTLTGTNSPVLSGETTLDRDIAYSLIVLPGSSPENSLLLRDDLNFPSVGNFKIRGVALDPDAAAIDLVLVDSTGTVTKIGDGLAYRSASDYSEVVAGNYRLELRPAGSNVVISSIAAQDLKEGYIYSFFAFDGGAAAPSELVLNTDVAAIRFIQEMYTITNASAGNWQMVASGTGQAGSVDGQGNYLLQVIGSNPAPALSQVTVAATTANKANVSWRLTSEEPDTRVNIYISPGPISTSVVVSDTNNITSTVQVPVYGGGLVAADISSAVDGTPQSYEIDLDVAESGSYYVWIEADDGRNEPTRAYARKPGAAAGLADVNERGEFILTQDDLETLAVARPWETNWATANISLTEAFGQVTVTWNAFNNPDVDRYQLQISGGDLDDPLEIDIGDKREFIADGLTPGVEYDFQILAIDEDNNRTATSPVVKGTPATAPFNLSGPANLGTIAKAAATFELRLANPNSGTYPTHIALSAENVPAGLAVSFSKIDTPACGEVGVLEADLFCPAAGSGARVTMTVTPNGLARSGEYTIVVRAVGGGVERSLNLPVTVQGGNFTLDLSNNNVQLALPNVTAGETAGPPVDVTLTLNGFNNASNPVLLETYDVPQGVKVTFLRNGQPLTNPSIVAGQSVTVRLQAVTAPPKLRDPQNNTDPQSVSGELFVVGYAGGHWDFADGLQVQTFNPNPVLNRVSAPDPNNYEAFATAGAAPTEMDIQLVVPPQWQGGNVTLRPQEDTLPPDTAVTLNGNPTATFNSSGSYAVTVEATVADGVIPAWYYLNIEAVDSQGRVLYTLITDFGVDIPNVDFDSDIDNLTVIKAIPGETIFNTINVAIPASGPTEPLTIGLELDYTDLYAFDVITTTVRDGIGNIVGQFTVSEANSSHTPIEVANTPGNYTIETAATVKPNAQLGQRKIWYNLRSEPIWTESRIFVDVGYDFDGRGRTIDEQSSDPGGETIYPLSVFVPNAIGSQGIRIAVDEVLLDPEIEVSFRRDTGNPAEPFVKELILAPGTEASLEIRVTVSPDAKPAEYWFFLDFRTPTGNLLLDYNEFVISIADASLGINMGGKAQPI